MTQKTLDIHKR